MVVDNNIIVFLGDIHGRAIWKDILNREQWSKCIFMGDYFDPYKDIPVKDLCKNFYEILDLKEQYPDRVVLLMGNHDFHYIYKHNWGERYSRYSNRTAREAAYLLQTLYSKHTLRVAYTVDNILATHAGVTKRWFYDHRTRPEELPLFIEDELNEQPLGNFIFDSGPDLYECYGNSVHQGPLWVRPEALNLGKIDHYTQIVGHTQIQRLVFQNNVYYIDCLGTSKEYLTYNEITKEFTIKQIS